ncbi:MAG: hypothetical protein JSS66_06215 [Armatimonadetes bacterium]|nr:hypothetical protein [Armatimonadota bacterium]
MSEVPIYAKVLYHDDLGPDDDVLAAAPGPRMVHVNHELCVKCVVPGSEEWQEVPMIEKGELTEQLFFRVLDKCAKVSKQRVTVPRLTKAGLGAAKHLMHKNGRCSHCIIAHHPFAVLDTWKGDVYFTPACPWDTVYVLDNPKSTGVYATSEDYEAVAVLWPEAVASVRFETALNSKIKTLLDLALA